MSFCIINWLQTAKYLSIQKVVTVIVLSYSGFVLFFTKFCVFVKWCINANQFQVINPTILMLSALLSALLLNISLNKTNYLPNA